MAKSNDYPWIAAWGRQMGSYGHYIEGQQAQARQDGAPENAIYKRDEKWYTTDDIQNNRTRAELGLPLWATRPSTEISFSVPSEKAAEIAHALQTQFGITAARFKHFDLEIAPGSES